MRNTAGYQLASISIVYQANFWRRDLTDVLYADAIVPRGNLSTMHASRINFSSQDCPYSSFFVFSFLLRSYHSFVEIVVRVSDRQGLKIMIQPG